MDIDFEEESESVQTRRTARGNSEWMGFKSVGRADVILDKVQQKVDEAIIDEMHAAHCKHVYSEADGWLVPPEERPKGWEKMKLYGR
jgi:hypothetical protein